MNRALESVSNTDGLARSDKYAFTVLGGVRLATLNLNDADVRPNSYIRVRVYIH
ncbi:hypothetical protein [Mycobacterium lepromatosis]|uniref:hypothetical protein n=1 Tax=Mycobacterium lepromatosis TaxID=480418 RepID=UPI00138E4467|nr:hypothetical protein [Mycobacterium lepromatosis]